MERSEPTLVPEWLKSTGCLTGSGSAAQNLSSSSPHSDQHTVTLHARNKSSVSSVECDVSRSAFLDRSSSNFYRRGSSSNGSIYDKDTSSYSRSYSGFARNHRDREWEKDLPDFHDKDRSVLGDYRDRDHFDPLGKLHWGRIDKDILKRSQPISGKQGEGWSRRVAADPKNGNSNSKNHTNSNGLLGGSAIVSSIHKAAFERDFPSLGAEETKTGPEIGRVSSPGLSTAVQSLPMGASAVIGGEGWTSALVEVPVIIGSNSVGLSSVQQSVPATTSSVVSNTSTGLNMAETLAQAPSRARTVPQLSVETQRQELAIKQSRQLIPMTPSMPKASVLSPSEKPKPKTSTARTGELSMGTKTGQQQVPSSHLVNNPLRGGAVRSDVPKTSHGGKLLVLKATREKNGVSPTTKDGSSPTNASRVVNNNPLSIVPSAGLATPLRSPRNQKLGTVERKVPSLPIIQGPPVEKRHTTSQAQSRIDFFNLMRKKTSANLSSAVPDPNHSASPPILETVTEAATTPVSPQCSDVPSSNLSALEWPSENGGDINNGGTSEDSHTSSGDGNKHSVVDEVCHPDEEEAAFLRSLGWEENPVEKGGLTDEEINSFFQSDAFYQLCMSMTWKPSSRLYQSLQLRVRSHVASSGGASPGLGSSESETEA